MKTFVLECTCCKAELSKGSRHTAGRKVYLLEKNFTNLRGTSSKGKPLHTLKAVIDEAGNVITAFP